MDTTKKIILSLAVIVLFAFYSLHEKEEGSQATNKSLQQPAPTSAAFGNEQNAAPTVASTTDIYKDGSYTGTVADAFYGPLQVKVTISGNKISDIEFLQFPNDRKTSLDISNQSMPLLKNEAIANQSAKVDIVTGATQTSEAFMQTMQSALDQAKG